MKRITKKEIKEFENNVIELLMSYNAVRTENYGKIPTWEGIKNTYVCNTEMFGKVYFCIETDDHYTYSIYIRFENENYMNMIKDFTQNKDICSKFDFCELTQSRVLVQLENFIEEVTISKDEYTMLFAS